MNVGEGMDNKQTSVFELLKGIPSFCNVSSGTGKVDQDNSLTLKQEESNDREIHNPK
jgi:hypothetical protein